MPLCRLPPSLSPGLSLSLNALLSRGGLRAEATDLGEGTMSPVVEEPLQCNGADIEHRRKQPAEIVLPFQFCCFPCYKKIF